jgi:phosphoribosylformylglycinamidine cyclo-ligase
MKLISKVNVKGIAHITGGGFEEKLGRILPSNVSAIIDPSAWVHLPIFKLIKRLGKISREEMFKIFNMGIGMAVVVSPKDVNAAIKVLKSSGEKVHEIGAVVGGKGTVIIK